ncbi:MAG: hypothetical protein H7X76_02485 [Prolixibacteraceae bacterium]|nr:hypothetical protein [Burkholderiales bacterium]
MLFRALVTAVLFAFAGSVFANHCPMDMKKIDEALAKKPNISEARMADVKKWRAEGESLHKAGNHAESVKVLGKAMKALELQ